MTESVLVLCILLHSIAPSAQLSSQDGLYSIKLQYSLVLNSRRTIILNKSGGLEKLRIFLKNLVFVSCLKTYFKNKRKFEPTVLI